MMTLMYMLKINCQMKIFHFFPGLQIPGIQECFSWHTGVIYYPFGKQNRKILPSSVVLAIRNIQLRSKFYTMTGQVLDYCGANNEYCQSVSLTGSSWLHLVQFLTCVVVLQSPHYFFQGFQITTYMGLQVSYGVKGHVWCPLMAKNGVGLGVMCDIPQW